VRDETEEEGSSNAALRTSNLHGPDPAGLGLVVDYREAAFALRAGHRARLHLDDRRGLDVDRPLDRTADLEQEQALSIADEAARDALSHATGGALGALLSHVSASAAR